MLTSYNSFSPSLQRPPVKRRVRQWDKSRRVAMAVWHRRIGSLRDLNLTNAKLGALCGTSSGFIQVADQLDNETLCAVFWGDATVSARYRALKQAAEKPEPGEQLLGYLS